MTTRNSRPKPLPVYYYTEFNPGAYPEQFPMSVVKAMQDGDLVGYDVVDAEGEDLAGKTFKTVEFVNYRTSPKQRR